MQDLNIGIILFILGTIFFIYKLILSKIINEIIFISKIKKRGIKTKGILVDLVSSTDLDGLKTYKSVYEYIVDEKKYTMSDKHSSMTKPAVGKEIELFYDSENPGIGFVNSSFILPFLYFQIIFILAIIIVISIFAIKF